MKLTGSVEVRVLDSETLEVLDVIKQSNVITKNASNDVVNQGVFGNNIFVSTSTADHYEDWCHVRDCDITGFVPVGVASPELVGAVGATPAYVQLVRRFNAPAATRQISTILLSNTIATASTFLSNIANAYVKLTTPCTQTNTQILDVYYRIQIVDAPSGSSYNNYLYDKLDTLKAIFGIEGVYSDILGPTLAGIVPMFSHVGPSSNTNPTALGTLAPFAGFDKSIGISSTATTGNVGSLGYQYKTWSYSISQGVGTLFGSMSMSRQKGSYTQSTYAQPAFTTMNINAPNGSKIQPIFSHAASTLTSTLANPFLDSQPSTGTGIVNYTGTWTPGNFPELYKIQIVTAGPIGTATYKFAKRHHFGFVGASYISVVNSLPGLYNNIADNKVSRIFKKPHGAGKFNTNFEVNGYGQRVERYDNTRIMSYDQTGVSRYDCVTQVTEIWDSTTTPVLNATNIKQSAVNPGDGSIWVGCSNTGIYRISADGLTITNFTISNGLLSNSIYALDIGRNNSIWAVYSGGVVTSNDNGATWISYYDSGDQYYNNVSLLLKLNGTNGSTVITDSAIVPHTSTVSGTAQISTAVTRNGSPTAVFASSTDQITVTSMAPYATSLSTFTVECWARFSTTKYSKQRVVSAGSPGNEFFIGTNPSGFLRSYVIDTLGVYREITGTNIYPVIGTWYHLASVLNAGVLTFFVDGVIVGTVNCPNPVTLTSSTQNIQLGSATSEYLDGNIDNVRITPGIARYTSSFVVYDPEFPSTTPVNNSSFYNAYLATDWASVNYMRVDPTHVDDRMCIVRHADTPIANSIGYIWWSRSTSQTSLAASHNGTSGPRKVPAFFNVSDTDGMWVVNASDNNFYRLDFGSGSGTIIETTTSSNNVRSVMFIRDIANTQDLLLVMIGVSPGPNYVLYDGTGATSFISKKITLYNSSGTLVSSIAAPPDPNVNTTGGDIAGPGGSYASSVVYLGNGVIAGFGTSYNGIHFGIITSINGNGTPTGGTGIEHIIWKSYGWDGTQWVLDHPGARPTHNSNQLMSNGINVNFVDGGTGTSFISNDYYTASVNDGVLKNNAMTLSGSSIFYHVPTNQLSDFDGVIRLYPWTTGVVTWRKVPASVTVNGDNSLISSIPYRTYSMNASSKNRVFGDFSISGTFNDSTIQEYDIGLHPVSEFEQPSVRINAFNLISFSRSGNNLTIVNSANSPIGYPPEISGTTTWNISRTGASLSFYTAGVLRYTTTNSTYSFIIRVRFDNQNNGLAVPTINPITINSSGPGYYVGMGNSSTGTGIYNNKMLSTEFINNKPNILINGSVLTSFNGTADTPPGPGGMSVSRQDGMLFCNAADVGKTVTGTYITSYQTSTPCNIPPI